MSTHTESVQVQLITQGLPFTYIGTPSPQPTYQGSNAPYTVLGTLNVGDGTITMDETATPYIEAEFTCSIPALGLLGFTDPRDPNARLLITVTQTYTPWNAGTTTTRTFNLALRSRTFNETAATMTLVARSDEGFLMDFYYSYPLVQTGVTQPSYTTINQAMSAMITSQMLGSTDASFQPVLPIAGDTTSTWTDAPQWQPGTNGWDAVDALAQPTNLRLYCDENRGWNLVSRDRTLPNLVQLSSARTITDASDEIDRDDDLWCDSCLITYNWNDTGGTAHVAYDFYPDRSPTYSGLQALPYAYHRTKVITYDNVRKTGSGAAKLIVQRAQLRSQSVTMSAVNDFSISPGWQFTAFIDTTGVPRTGVISSVSWNLSNGEMSLVTRNVQNSNAYSWVLQPQGKRWLDVPAGTSWANMPAAS